jgi:hypothetical protein
VAAAPAESSGVEVRAEAPESIVLPFSTILAQRDRHSGPSEKHGGRSGGSIFGGGHSSGGSIFGGGSRWGSEHGEGDHSHGGGTIIPIPIPIPTRPNYPPNYYPPNYYPPRRTYPPRTPTNTVPTQPVQPETNIVLVDPEPNNFLDDLGIRPITAKEIKAFTDQITKKNQELGEQLKDLFPGNEQAIDKLVNMANNGQLDPKTLQDFVGALGGGLNVQQQILATGLLKQLTFNNLALRALVNININNLNINIANINLVNVNINVNVLGGGWIGGFWGFPWWPWNYPIWLGPGVWWGPCVYCPYPYYDPGLTGADALGLPYSIADPVADDDGAPVTSGILLTNKGGAKVNYTLDGQRFAMEPDYRQTVTRTSVVIAFDRGGSFGQAKYRITEGWYEFAATERGWELYKQTAKVTLNNGDNPFEFKYVLNNQPQTLAAGSQREHTGKYPLVLRFDNGKGATKQKVLKKGTFKIALGGEGSLDLFRPEDVTLPAPITEMAKQHEQQTQNIFAQPDQIPNLFGPTVASTKSLGPPPTPSPGAPPPPSLFGDGSG